MAALDRTESDVSYSDERTTGRKIWDRIQGRGKDTGGLQMDWSARDKYNNPKAYVEPKEVTEKQTKEISGSKLAALKTPAAKTTAAAPKAAPVNPFMQQATNYTVKFDPVTGQQITVDQNVLDQQQRAAGLMEQAALGNAPSAAQNLMQSGLNQSIQAQMAMARSGRGGYNPAAIRGAMQQGSQMQQENILQQSALRANEMAGARGQFGDLTSQLAAQQAQRAQAQAGLTQEANLANQTAALQAQQQQLQGRLGYGGLVNQQTSIQAELAMAKNKLAQAKTDADRKYWLEVIGKIGDVGGSVASKFI